MINDINVILNVTSWEPISFFVSFDTMSNPTSKSTEDDAITATSETSSFKRQSSSMTQSWIENNHNMATIKIRPKHKVNLSLDLNSLDDVLKDLNQVMPENSPIVPEPLSASTTIATRNFDLDFVTLPRRKRHEKDTKKNSNMHPDIVLSSDKIQQLCFGDGDVQNEVPESPKCYPPTMVPWQSLVDIAEVEHSKVGLSSTSNILCNLEYIISNQSNS